MQSIKTNPSRSPFVFLALFLLCLFLSGDLMAQDKDRNQGTSYSSQTNNGHQKDNQNKKEVGGNTQETAKKGFDPSRLTYGGSLSLAFGNPTFIYLNPQIGYRVTDWWVPGIGPTYVYHRREYPGGLSRTASFYGGSIFSRFFLGKRIFLQGELEYINVSYKDEGQAVERFYRTWRIHPYIGGGYFFGGFAIMAMYNLNYNEQTSLNPSPLSLRVNFMFMQ